MYFSHPATGKAPPVITSLDHLPTAWGGLFAAAGRQKGSSQCGEVAEPAKPEGLCRALPQQPVGARHARPATWRTSQFSGLSPFLYCFVGKCPAPSTAARGLAALQTPVYGKGFIPPGARQQSAGRWGRRPPQIAFFTLRYDLFPAAVPPLLPRTASPAPASLSCWGLRCRSPIWRPSDG